MRVCVCMLVCECVRVSECVCGSVRVRVCVYVYDWSANVSNLSFQVLLPGEGTRKKMAWGYPGKRTTVVPVSRCVLLHLT